MQFISENDFNIDISNYPNLPNDYLSRSTVYRYICQMIFNIDKNYEFKRQFFLESGENRTRTMGEIANIAIKKCSVKYDNIKENQIRNVFPNSKIISIFDFKNKMDSGEIIFKIWDEFPLFVKEFLHNQVNPYPYEITPFKIYAIYECAKYTLGCINNLFNHTDFESLAKDAVFVMNNAQNKISKKFIIDSGLEIPREISNIEEIKNLFAISSSSSYVILKICDELDGIDFYTPLILTLITANAILKSKIGNYKNFINQMLI
ncbi:hypothetical protein CSPB12327_03535 [Campylobacter sp. RM12327]|uniref:hypothetical protein n=1 Tax=Campylobacter sputorum TaxID=206 RepID=UPI00125F5005|nr:MULTISPECIES: hypothetical protein [Campylobacter]MBE7357482.1 hypothetical protein [Campylobacter sp. RM11302]MBF6669218.1 hypothetical protein [Campylobacter sp. RM12327]MBF6674307.1 hypothetical protein [Campylobacter sp. RM13538]MBF6675348.1 hypothetical protein [Campylobacter sp. RM12321]MBF6676992.1 hypothetical protein [Campylobacter sp. RM11259]